MICNNRISKVISYCVVIVATLAIIVTGVSVKAPECPSSGIVILPHPKEYNLHYICQDGKSTIYKWPDGLHFNSTIKQWDSLPAGRFPRMNPEIESDISEEKADNSNCIGTCPILDSNDKTILLPYRDDCNKFCSCSNGTPIVLSCPPGLHFHEAEQICNWPWIADCPW
ncbi:PREDICTED: peritrophin-1-like isoform X1 [Acromyrmex echinatior]|uniref:peritrophin-1-like isoform X1 n=1 Tax=Acromyrmex echinatior TaxID=103372 RepID=UPI000580C25C|nr:PREDICTED: peritrophin-1-like isoform X1 [Acromyrmex echinatior]